MGVDFIIRTHKTFSKHLDRARADLGTSDLFTRGFQKCLPSFEAEIGAGCRLRSGQELTVEIDGGELIVVQETRIVARCSNPPAELLHAIEASCGIGIGTVEAVHEMAGSVEVSVC